MKKQLSWFVQCITVILQILKTQNAFPCIGGFNHFYNTLALTNKSLMKSVQSSQWYFVRKTVRTNFESFGHRGWTLLVWFCQDDISIASRRNGWIFLKLLFCFVSISRHDSVLSKVARFKTKSLYKVSSQWC